MGRSRNLLKVISVLAKDLFAYTSRDVFLKNGMIMLRLLVEDG